MGDEDSFRQRAFRIAVYSAVAGSALYLLYTQLPRRYKELLCKNGQRRGIPTLTGEARQFKVLNTFPLNHNVKIIRFALPSDKHVLGLPTASCITVNADIGGEVVTRPYTPITTEEDFGYFDLLVKYYENGKMSKHLHSLRPGDGIVIKGPFKKIPYTANMKARLGMIAGGTGITPMLQLINRICLDPSDRTEITLIFANQTHDDIFLLEYLNDLCAKHRNLKIRHTLEHPPVGWDGLVGRVTRKMVENEMPPPSNDAMILVCGPDRMLDSLCGPKGPNKTQGTVGGILQEIGYTESQVYKF